MTTLPIPNVLGVVRESNRGQVHLKIKSRKTPVVLRRQEWLALRALFFARGTPVSEPQLLEAIAGGEHRCPKLVQVVISTLRRKLGSDLGHKMIRRVRMFGYMVPARYFSDR